MFGSPGFNCNGHVYSAKQCCGKVLFLIYFHNSLASIYCLDLLLLLVGKTGSKPKRSC
jgi:hypothetical protein